MTPDVQLFPFHAGLAALLFWAVNWLGGHSMQAGYLPLTLYSRADEAPAFNFLFRVLAPVVFLHVVAAILYSSRLDRLVHGLYWVTIYYVVARWVYIVVMERSRIVNWRRNLLNATCAIALSYVAYEKVLRFKVNILPDWTTIANELWLAIALFGYATINGIQSDADGSTRRLQRHIRRSVSEFQRRFGEIVTREATSRHLEALAYSVMVYETFNRPWVCRAIESHVLFPLRLSTTLGVMQVRATERITDETSVAIGTRSLQQEFDFAHSKLLPKLIAQFSSPNSLVDSAMAADLARQRAEVHALRKYNVRSDYAEEVLDVKNSVIAEFYPDLLPSVEDDDGILT